MNLPNIFLYGLSGAGKDTVANYLRDEYNYLKLRIAGTIKQYVFETRGFETQEEFENEKRTNKDVRLQHNTFGNQYDHDGIELSKKKQEASLNRLESLINKQALEFEIATNLDDKSICIVDVRTFEEAKKLLEANFLGIFLTKQNKSEYAIKSHKTEYDLIGNQKILDLSQKDNIFIIRNHENANNDNFGWFGHQIIDGKSKIIIQAFTTDGSNQQLLDTVDECILMFQLQQKSK